MEDLESKLNLNELEAIIKAKRDQEHRHNKFMAAIKGIDIDSEGDETVADRVEAIKRRAEAKLRGKTEDELELDAFGIDFEIE